MDTQAVVALILIASLIPDTHADGSLDIQSKWWTKDVGSAGGYLTSDFRNNIFVPVTRSIIASIDQISKEQVSQNKYDNVFGVIIGIQTVIMIAAYYILNKKIRESP